MKVDITHDRKVSGVISRGCLTLVEILHSGIKIIHYSSFNIQHENLADGWFTLSKSNPKVLYKRVYKPRF